MVKEKYETGKWLTDIHLNFIDLARRRKFYQESVDSTCDRILISGDIAEAPCIKQQRINEQCNAKC